MRCEIGRAALEVAFLKGPEECHHLRTEYNVHSNRQSCVTGALGTFLITPCRTLAQQKACSFHRSRRGTGPAVQHLSSSAPMIYLPIRLSHPPNIIDTATNSDQDRFIWIGAVVDPHLPAYASEVAIGRDAALTRSARGALLVLVRAACPVLPTPIAGAELSPRL